MKNLGSSINSPSQLSKRGIGPFIDLRTGGTFTRASEASYLIGAATDGTTPFMSWSVTNERRLENRGDGFGSWYLTEGSGTNQMLQSENFANAAWTALLCTPTDNADFAPDCTGTADASTIAFQANATAQVLQLYGTVPPNAANAVQSVYMRAAAPQTVSLIMLQKDTTTETTMSCSVTTTWQRFALSGTVGTGVVAPSFIIRNNADAASRTISAWGAMVEVNGAAIRVPTSYVRTTSAVVIRATDLLSFSAAQFPVNFIANGLKFICKPLYGSADIVAAIGAATSAQVLGFFGNSLDGIRISNSGGTADIEFLSTNSNDNIFKDVLSWLRDATISMDGQKRQAANVGAGYVTNNARGRPANLANLPMSLTSNTLNIGSLNTASQFFYGRIYPIVSSVIPNADTGEGCLLNVP